MKVLTIIQAIENGLLRETTNGIAINDIKNTMKLEEKEIKKILGNIYIPSIIVSDDEKTVVCTNITKEVKDNLYGYTEKRQYTFPRVYTSDNTPVLVGGISYSGRFPDYTNAIQDNENIDIDEYTLRIKSAKGGLDEKAIVNKESNLVEEVKKLDKPIELSFKDNTLEVRGEKVKLEENDKIKEVLPIINRDSFMDYEYYIELADGRKSDLTYGYKAKPTLNRVCLDIIEKIDKLKIIGNINEKEIECGEYNGNVETADNYIRMNPTQIEREYIEDEILEKLMREDSELDRQLNYREQLLKQYELQDKTVQESTQEER